jgi:hypothetical protein
LHIEVVDDAGGIVANVIKTLYVRSRDRQCGQHCNSLARDTASVLRLAVSIVNKSENHKSKRSFIVLA